MVFVLPENEIPDFEGCERFSSEGSAGRKLRTPLWDSALDEHGFLGMKRRVRVDPPLPDDDTFWK